MITFLQFLFYCLLLFKALDIQYGAYLAIIIHTDTKEKRTFITKSSQWMQFALDYFCAKKKKNGASRGAESFSFWTIKLPGLHFIHRLSETQEHGTKRGKCLGEPLAGADRSCTGDLRELQGTDAKNHRTMEAALGRINSRLGGCSIFVGDR